MAATGSAQPRRNGRRRLLSAIRRKGPVPRVDLAAMTGISRATVTTITAELLRAGLIEEVETAPRDGGRGRPKVDLRVRGDSHRVVGMKVAHGAISLALMDFAGEILAEHTHPMAAAVMPPDALIAEIRAALDSLMGDPGALAALAGVGIGLPGIVDVHSGNVHWSPTLTARNVDLRARIETALGVPVFLDNDANLVALAEKSFGKGRGASDFIVVTVEAGVGMGLVLDNELYRGTRGCGAEFGHTKVALDGALCRCGQRGCLEAYVADYALTREASSVSGEPVDVPTLLDRAAQGDPTAGSIVTRAGRMFALGLANLVNIFDPQLIILAGARMQLSHLYAEEVIAAIRELIVQVDQPPPEVVIHNWGDLMWAKGAGAYALEGVENIVLKEIAEHDA